MNRKEEIRQSRIKKIELLKNIGIHSYPGKTKRTHTILEAIDSFDHLLKKEEELILSGRVRSFRGHGKLTFFTIEDGTGEIQGLITEEQIGKESYDLFLQVVDVGDFIEVRGILFTTKKGEKTIKIADYKMLAKSILPLPEKWHGLKDEDERFRRRYLDLIFNKDVRERFEIKAKIIKAIRSFLDNEGFIEVETSVLQTIYGGADAKPFKTKINAFDLETYLRISLELDLKRLIVGGFEKVYEIGRVFRNEGVGRMHNPDFTMLEFYWAYSDYKELMKLTEEMFSSILTDVFGKEEISYEGKKISFKAPWPRVEYSELIKKHTKLDINELNRDALYNEALKLGVSVDKSLSKAKIVDEIYKKHCRPKIWEPTFVIHHPADSKPLAKPLDDDPSKLASFQLVVAGGWEVINAYSELNDPLLQRSIFEEQERYFEEGMEEAQRMDIDFVEALEYGMPPTAGFGMGIDRITSLFTDSHSLREVILFPTMKPREKE
jgi:lysyl-tRNA synthetase, class II